MLPQASIASVGDGAKAVVVIDAGHGGEDGGAIGVNGCLEKDLNLSMARKLYELLCSMDIDCAMTRDSDTLLYDKTQNYQGKKKRLDMRERLRIASSYPNAIFISIHQNSFPSEKYSGLQIYYSENSPSSFTLAQGIERGIKAVLQHDNSRTAKPSDGNVYLLDSLSCPAILVECGFLSNAEECDRLCDDDYQNELCSLLAVEIERFLSE